MRCMFKYSYIYTGSVVFHGNNRGHIQKLDLKLAILSRFVPKPSPGSVRIMIGMMVPS